MQDNSNQRQDGSFDRKGEVRRISQHRVRDLLLMALCAPLRLAGILGWRVLGKKLRARGRLENAIAGLPYAAERWNTDRGEADLAVVHGQSGSRVKPVFCIHVHVVKSDDPRDVRGTIRSALKQSLAPARVLVTTELGASTPPDVQHELVELIEDCSPSLDAMRKAMARAQELGADWLVPVDAKTRLPRHAIVGYVSHLLRQIPDSKPAVLFGDESERSYLKPKPQMWLKPQWDSRMALSQDFVSNACALNVSYSLEILDHSQASQPEDSYELILHAADRYGCQHTMRVVAFTDLSTWHQKGARTAQAVRRFLGDRADDVAEGPFGTVSVRFPLPERLPKISVLVATRDRLELLRTCVDGVLESTDYHNLELIIADNQSVEPETLAYMDTVSSDPRVKVVRWPHPFNYSAINNFAASHATGQYLCLLNNDIEVLEPEWLSEMMREALQRGVGAVGARLLYPDRSIQHAGVAIGIGNAAGHAHKALPEGEPGYYAQALIARGASAVTAACLVVAKEHFDAVGGLDKDGLAVAYNDVDLCLKLRELGLKNIYTPLATLIHHESKSRGLDFAPEHLDRYMAELSVFQDRWDTTRIVDPWHHPRLDRGKEEFALS